MRRRIYLSPCSGVAWQGAIVGRFLWGYKIVYRDCEGVCKSAWAWGREVVLDRPALSKFTA
jgi:hypothetical protein